MRIDKVELKNIGPHKSLLVEFKQGLIGLIGSNGAGKSTLINSIYAALTNDFSRFGNAKSDIITNGSTDASYIKLTGKHAGQLFELIRWLKPNKSEFTIGAVNYSKATDVNEAIAIQLNIPKIIVDKYVFVNQWEMFNFLDQSPAERAKTFQYLCGTEIAAQAYKACNDFATRQEAVQVIDNSLELTETLAEQLQLLKTNKAKVIEAKAQMLPDEVKQAHQEIIDSMDFANAAQLSFDSWSKKAVDLKSKIEKENQQLLDLKIKIKKRTDWQTNNSEKISMASKLLEAYAEYERQAQLKKSALQSKQRAEIKLRDMEILVKDETKYCPKLKRDKVVAQVGELRLLVRQAESLELNQDDCPHCGQTLSADYRDNILKTLQTNKASLAELEAMLSYSKQFDENLEKQTELQNTLKTKIEEADKLIESLNSSLSGFGSADKEEAEKLTIKNKQATTQLEDLKKEQNVCQTRLDGLAGELKTVDQLVSKYRKESTEKPTTVSYNKAIEELQAHEEAKLAKSQAIGAYKASKEIYDKTADMLNALKAKLAKQIKIQNLTSVVREVAELFHWSNLPKTVAQNNLELLISDINDNLALFNHPFTVEADVDLTLKVIFPGQLPVKAKQLSGGQKVILAIAFRSALDRVFGCDTGMLFLDEPTAGLDADNLNYFHTALQALAQKVGDKQLVVITHVHEFKETFDQVIEITKS